MASKEPMENTHDGIEDISQTLKEDIHIDTDIDTDIDAKLNQLLIGRANHTKWVALLRLYKIICNNGGLIFGGATRDYIKRTLASKKFYEYCECNKKFKKEYNNKEYHPESFKDRTLLPNDIDVYIKEDSYKELIKILQRVYVVRMGMGSDDICYFFKQNEIFTNALEYKRCYVNFFKPVDTELLNILFADNITKLLNIKIDFIVLKKNFYENEQAIDGGILHPPFGNPDFDINQVGMYSVENNIEIKIFNSLLRFHLNELYNVFGINPLENMEVKYIQQELFRNIANSIAVPIYPNIQQVRMIFGANYKAQINFWRLLKIYKKGYAIDGRGTLGLFKHIKYASDDFVHNDEDKCIICLDIFSREKKWFQFGCKCNVKMHLECYTKYIRKPSVNEYNTNILCPHCREPNIGECPCSLMNFMSSLNHRSKLLETYNSSDDKCLDSSHSPNDMDNICTKWYYKCKCCNA